MDISTRSRHFLSESGKLPPGRIDEDPFLPENFYTAVTQRDYSLPRNTKGTNTNFNALNRNFVPCPGWKDQRPESRRYRQDLLDDWRKLVKKESLPRGPVSIPVRVKTPQTTVNSDLDYNQSKITMFKSINKLAPTSREYKVDPEWVSENGEISTSRAIKLMQLKGIKFYPHDRD